MARSRRDFLRRAFWGAGALTGTQAWAGQQSSPAQNSNAQHEHMRMQHDGQEPEKEVKTSHSKMHESSSAPPAVSVQTPDIPDLP
jgi:hypothetical protein